MATYATDYEREAAWYAKNPSNATTGKPISQGSIASGGSAGQSASANSSTYGAPSSGAYIGNTGKSYSIGSDGSMAVYRPDGSKASYATGDSNYQSALNSYYADNPVNKNQGGPNSGLWYQEDYDRVGLSSPSGTVFQSSGTSNKMPGYYDNKQGVQFYDDGSAYQDGKLLGQGEYKPLPINPYTGTSEGYGTQWLTGEDYYQKLVAEAAAQGRNLSSIGTARNSDYINLNAIDDAKRAGYYGYLESNQNSGNAYGPNGSNVRPDPYINPTLTNEGYIHKRYGWELEDQMEILKKAEAEARRAGELATESAVLQLEGNRDKINQQAESQAQQEYIKYMLGGKNLNESMAMQGMNGGMAESSILEHQANYQNNHHNITQAQSNSLNDLDRDIAIMRANGDLQGAQIAAEYQLKMADAAARNNELLFQHLEAEKNYQLQLKQMNQSNQQQMIDNQYRQQAFDYGIYQDDRNWNYNVGRDNIMDNRYNQEWELSKRMEDLRYRQEQARLASLLAKSAGTSSRTTNGTSGGSGSQTTTFDTVGGARGLLANIEQAKKDYAAGRIDISVLNSLLTGAQVALE